MPEAAFSLSTPLRVLSPGNIPPSVALPTSKSPDSELLSLCAEAEALWAESNRLYGPWDNVVGGPPPYLLAVMRSLAEQAHVLEDQVFRMPATTPEGLRAKASLAIHVFCLDLDGEPHEGERLPWSICRDLLLGGEA